MRNVVSMSVNKQVPVEACSFCLRVVFIASLCLLLQENLPCQEAEEDSLVDTPRHHLGAEASFNAHDVFISLTFHYAQPFGEGFSLIGSFSFRPVGKEMLIQDAPGVYLYLREERISVLLGLERQLYLTAHFSGFVHALGGMSFPTYRGTQRGRAEGMFPVVGVGIQWSIPSGRYFSGDIVSLRLGQQYINLPQDKFRGYVSILAAL